MRPKKIVLIADADADRVSRLTLVLETWGYRVERAMDAPAALAAMDRLKTAMRRPDVLIVDAELFGAENLVSQGRELQPEMRSLMLGFRSGPELVQTVANVFLPRMMCTPTEICERLRVLCLRKRGPKPAGVLLDQERKTA
jgi:two-component system response regulator CpxR